VLKILHIPNQAGSVQFTEILSASFGEVSCRDSERFCGSIETAKIIRSESERLCRISWVQKSIGGQNKS
jgi:hypothetical protein